MGDIRVAVFRYYASIAISITALRLLLLANSIPNETLEIKTYIVSSRKRASSLTLGRSGWSMRLWCCWEVRRTLPNILLALNGLSYHCRAL